MGLNVEMSALVRSILSGKTDLTSDEIWSLCGDLQDLYRERPNVVEIPRDRVIFVGDLHGELASALSVQRYIERFSNHYFVFLGDYADRGQEQIETFNLVIALALSKPNRVLMLRGNHESDEIAERYGFYDIVTKIHSFDVYKHYSRVFEVLPVAAWSPKNFFACHGGIPEGVTTIEQIQECNRRNANFPDDIVFQLVWNDPQEADFKFRPNFRSSRARYYGQSAFNTFMEAIDAQMMFRGHEVFPDGYQTFFEGRLVSVFSATYGTQVLPKIIRLGMNFQIEPIDLF
ncbi:hypothetical protein EU527_02760 [Candidatus Thorarchaeota archaeon]|nr:MAG: hypothetical protein EU527_02760 [Candidatus Thorarchaeota archaeon]